MKTKKVLSAVLAAVLFVLAPGASVCAEEPEGGQEQQLSLIHISEPTRH